MARIMSEKRKKHAAGFKAKIALEALKERESVRELAVRYGVHSSQINNWKKHLKEASIDVFEHPSKKKDASLNKETELFEQIGRLKMELEWLKKKFPDSDG